MLGSCVLVGYRDFPCYQHPLIIRVFVFFYHEDGHGSRLLGKESLQRKCNQKLGQLGAYYRRHYLAEAVCLTQTGARCGKRREAGLVGIESPLIGQCQDSPAANPGQALESCTRKARKGTAGEAIVSRTSDYSRSDKKHASFRALSNPRQWVK